MRKILYRTACAGFLVMVGLTIAVLWGSFEVILTENALKYFELWAYAGGIFVGLVVLHLINIKN
jgi:hypothetical protein